MEAGGNLRVPGWEQRSRGGDALELQPRRFLWNSEFLREAVNAGADVPI